MITLQITKKWNSPYLYDNSETISFNTKSEATEFLRSNYPAAMSGWKIDPETGNYFNWIVGYEFDTIISIVAPATAQR